MTSWLKDYLEQGLTGNLKTAHFPKEHGLFKMRVSFGQGTPTRVPWVSFPAQGMSTSNGYYPVFLFYKELRVLILSFGISETNEFDKTWGPEVLGAAPLVREVIPDAPRYGDSWVFRTYSVLGDPGNLVLSSDRGTVTWVEAMSDLDEILQLYAKSLEEEVLDKASQVSAGLFYMEKQLEDFIIENWQNSELGEKYELLFEDGHLVSQQYRTAIGPIDILAKDRSHGNYVVIELKRNQTSDDTVGQITRYMGWVREHLRDKNVHGLIIAGKFDEKLHYAQSMIPEIDVYLYEVQFSLREHRRS
jgi:hypothetical protein